MTDYRRETKEQRRDRYIKELRADVKRLTEAVFQLQQSNREGNSNDDREEQLYGASS